MKGGACEYFQGPFPCNGEQAENEVDGLKDRYRFDSWVEIGGEKVPEELWPEVAFNRCYDLICGKVSTSSCVAA
jgi:hypothetical protein